jgi:hypothetical protein
MLVVVLILVSLLFLFRTSMYTGGCTSKNPEFLNGNRCYDSNGNINLAGPFCKEECKGTWK